LYILSSSEDGIRYSSVTGVQSCALPICVNLQALFRQHVGARAPRRIGDLEIGEGDGRRQRRRHLDVADGDGASRGRLGLLLDREIGRAACWWRGCGAGGCRGCVRVTYY